MDLIRELDLVLVLLVGVALSHDGSVVYTSRSSSLVDPAFPTGYTLVIIKSSYSSFYCTTTDIKP
jgi:hypothetical protein